MRRLFMWAVVLVLATSGVATAQENTTGSISGAVTDAQGGVIPGVTVEVTSERGTQTYFTGANGRFLAPFLIPGAYAVTLSLSGFGSIEQTDIGVALGQRVPLSFTMKRRHRGRGGTGHRVGTGRRHHIGRDRRHDQHRDAGADSIRSPAR